MNYEKERAIWVIIMSILGATILILWMTLGTWHDNPEFGDPCKGMSKMQATDFDLVCP